MLKIGQSKNSSRFKRIFAEVTCRADVIPSKSLARFKNGLVGFATKVILQRESRLERVAMTLTT